MVNPARTRNPAARSSRMVGETWPPCLTRHAGWAPQRTSCLDLLADPRTAAKLHRNSSCLCTVTSISQFNETATPMMHRLSTRNCRSAAANPTSQSITGRPATIGLPHLVFPTPCALVGRSHTRLAGRLDCVVKPLRERRGSPPCRPDLAEVGPVVHATAASNGCLCMSS